MQQQEQIIIKQSDVVQILTTKNVKYVSSTPGETPTPIGMWIVAAAIDGDLLITKHNTVIRIPASDVLKIADHDISGFDMLSKGLLNG